MQSKLIWIAVVFLAFGALVTWGAWVFRSQNRRLEARIAEIESHRRDLYQARFTPSVVDDVNPEAIPPMDIAGAWAYEMAASGIHVSDEEIKLQRKMRVEANL